MAQGAGCSLFIYIYIFFHLFVYFGAVQHFWVFNLHLPKGIPKVSNSLLEGTQTLHAFVLPFPDRLVDPTEMATDFSSCLQPYEMPR